MTARKYAHGIVALLAVGTIAACDGGGGGGGGTPAVLTGLEVVSQQVHFNDGDEQNVGATCPSGKVAINGGWKQIDGNGSIDYGITRQASTAGVPPAIDDTWTVRIRVTQALDSKVFAVCANTPAGMQVLTTDIGLDAYGHRADVIAVNCPAGKAAIGGGFVRPGFLPGLQAERMGPGTSHTSDGQTVYGWAVGAINESNADPGGGKTMRVFVNCMPTPAGYELIESATGTYNGGVRGVQSTGCNGGKFAIAGYAGVVHEGLAYSKSVVYQSAPSGEQAQAWRNEVQNYDSQPHQYGNSVLCVDRPAAPTSTQ
jgi:hypothetical protein